MVVKLPELNSISELIPLTDPQLLKSFRDCFQATVYFCIFVSQSTAGKQIGLTSSKQTANKKFKHHYLEVEFKQNFKLNQNVRVKDHQHNKL